MNTHDNKFDIQENDCLEKNPSSDLTDLADVFRLRKTKICVICVIR